MMDFDLQISQYLFQLGRALPAIVVPFLAVALIWLLFAFALYRANQRPAPADKILFLARVGVAAVLGFLFNGLLAYFYFRARPFVDLGFTPLISEPMFLKSFPSDHAAVSWAVAAIIFFDNKTSGYWAGIAAGFICLGRVLSGVHYVGDVLFGAGLGIIIAGLVFKYLPSGNFYFRAGRPRGE
ncbi:MAG: phosphatase PAP2 family protein [Patescibacteria group bacterium]